ncbi:MAG: Lrp/AsnC family transcriptional regulator [Candidatus Micrarchaeota archaeon]|nr:Lrp/AsnC family transcriptional regulator [Candidatus Micrarchaeota archaeon]
MDRVDVMRRKNQEREEILRKMISLLEANARIKNKDLAKGLNISEKSVKRYLDELIKNGYISGFTVIRGKKIESEQISAFVHINVIRGVSTSSLCRRLMSELACNSINEVSGDYDIICRIEAESIDELNKKIDIIRNYKGVERTRTFIVLKEWQ